MVKKLKAFILRQIKQGLTPDQIALTVAIGSVLGLFPVPGVATLLCVIAAIVLRLNHAVIQAVNYAVYPLQLVLMGGYYALGIHWFGDGGAVESVLSISVLLREEFWTGLWSMKQFILYAIMVWAITSPAIATALYLPVRAAAKTLQGLSRQPFKSREQVAAASD
jgi:uncharacterized protein (DUF2062 family)